jgi:hypothetical protein
VVLISGYAHLVPSIGADDHLFLKTIIPSRKATIALPPRRRTMNPLDHEEQEILEAFEAGTLR